MGLHFLFTDKPIEATVVVGGGDQAKLEIWKDDDGVHVRIDDTTEATKRGWSA